MISDQRPILSAAQSMEIAWRHYRVGTREDAMMISLRVLKVEPRNADALHLLGILAYEANQQDEAIRLIADAIRVNKKYAPMHGNLALAKLAKGDLAGAAASARRAFTLRPSYADAHRVLGLVYQKKGKLKEAIEEFQRAQRLGLNSADLQKHLAKAFEDLSASSPLVS
jgi:tetratricopeptide (TPR) repeat protein